MTNDLESWVLIQSFFGYQYGQVLLFEEGICPDLKNLNNLLYPNHILSRIIINIYAVIMGKIFIIWGFKIYLNMFILDDIGRDFIAVLYNIIAC